MATARSNEAGIAAVAIAIAVIFLWIGRLKFSPYDVESITPFVAQRRFLPFFYPHPADDAAHLTCESAFAAPVALLSS